ncbi:conserved Plasmodium protein, unknown function [Plasmodium berghei]|uniref:Uncharacterized protein n=2 Tax=Plasmodium berghei TaxID=5821 RepID=A0A509AI46_PLABA|nr:conserved Plasmodium protein, unknown function [Plasmodium berghei ANKA]SCM21721.1 conserved Plasmodium protein, unknown function [Plasmodium berghei]SCN24978.1 conserved Plasmodium protein, unknown function [Plasmodium berghei]SCO61510.1 conserved Plasmodium protein, unknown function [Plasmodium berghei]VUC55568.1 conserved Plasmodium protein, unknown function [Plasmodium berghei ANKA]|eukprot:XP_034421378.1 conserved Plasmodium protein, unknown function [Plasmodium berghei ANKA]
MDINNPWDKYYILNYLKDEFSLIYKKVENIIRTINKNYICYFTKNFKYLKDTHTFLFYIILFNVSILIFLCFLLFKYMLQNKKNNDQNKHEVAYNRNGNQYIMKKNYPRKETYRKKKNEEMPRFKEEKFEFLQTLIDTKNYPIRNINDQSELSEYYYNNNKKKATEKKNAEKKTLNRKNKKEIYPLDNLSLTQSFPLSCLSPINMDVKRSRRRSKRGKEKEENQKKAKEKMEKEIIIYSDNQKKQPKSKRSTSKKKSIPKNDGNDERPRSRSRKPRKI